MRVNREKIVWGTCWYNESVDTIIDFLKETEIILKTMNLSYSFVIFDAMINRDKNEVEILKNNIECCIIQNQHPCFPNKNYGVYAIVNFASDNNSDLVTVVDSDWKIEKNIDFVKGLLLPIIEENKEIVLPDIESGAGRSNYILGVPMMKLFYHQSSHIVKTPFPGVFAAKTDKMQSIISSVNYHFDWGGEWDIVAEAIKQNLKIISPPLGLRGTRHRSSYSKTSDAFQIWRALFQGINEIKITGPNNNKDLYISGNFNNIKNILSGSASNQISMFLKHCRKETVSSTVYQIYNMVLLPLALILDGNDFSKIKLLSDFDSHKPYIKNEICYMSDIVIHSVNEAITHSELSSLEVQKRISNLSGGFMGDWNIGETKKAKERVHQQIKGVKIKWS